MLFILLFHDNFKNMVRIIKNIVKSVIPIVLMTPLVSCNVGNPLVLQTRDVDYLNKTGDVIHGNILDFNVPGGKAIEVYDTLLMVITNNPEGLLQIFDIRTKQPIASLCQQGRAKNEFSELFISKASQLIERNGDIIIVLRGEGGYVLKEVNVSASIREGHTIIEEVNNNLPFGCEGVVGLDNGIDRLFVFNNHNYNIDMEDYNPPTFSIINEDNTEEIKVYGRLIDFDNDYFTTFWYSGVLCKHPTKNIVVQCVSTMDYIHYFDFDNNNFYSIHQVGSPTFDNIKVPDTKNPDGSISLHQYYHFYESIATDNLFFVIYLNGDYSRDNFIESRGEAKELLAFDWDGNYVGGVKLDYGVTDLAYDSKHNILYGIRSVDERIVSFDLSDFIKSIDK